MKAVIYARYSSERQNEQSIDGQLRECNDFAKGNNISIVGTYVDRAQSGRSDKRIDFQRMLKDSEKQLFEAVIVWKVDRFGRNREDVALNKIKLRKNGVRLLYAKENIPDTPEGIILESVLEGLAEYYSANLSQNIIRGMHETALKCKFNGSGVPLGYVIDNNKDYQINNSNAKIVQLIFKRYDEGLTYAKIIEELTVKGYKTQKGKIFNHNAIARILSNRRYIGEYIWKDVIIPNGIPRIISDNLFERVQIKMEKNKKAPARKTGTVDFLLTTKLFCGHCEKPMIGDSGTGRNGSKFYYYSCSGRKNQKSGCDKKSVKKDALERLIVKETVSKILVDDVISFIADKVIEIQNSEHSDKSLLSYYEKSLSVTVNSINNIMKAIEQGILTDTTRARLLELEGEKADFESNIARENIERVKLTREQVVFFLERFKGGDIDDKEYQRQIIDTFINSVFLYDDKMIITYNYSGADNKVTLDIVEEAAGLGASKLSDKGSSKLPLSPPNER